MKKIISLILMMGFLSLSAQNTADRFTTANTDQPQDPRVDQMNFVPNEVIVKFKDEVPLSSGARLRAAGVSAVDKVLKANGVDSLVRLFPDVRGGMLRSAGAPRIVKDPQGRDMKIPNLDKIYKMTVPQLRSSGGVPTNIFQFIEELKALPEVEYAEPNYIYSVDDLQPVGPVLTADDVKKMQSTLRSSQSAVVPNDPLYNQQWYIPAVKADLVWEQTTGDTTQVIGILDTGVDWNHPDLKNKIWTNKDEIPDNGIDDDGNGLIDDVRGWDYINNDNNPMDDNSHGTHVAGIAAAETNNGIGIAGVCPKAKIMPIKVFQSSGTGDAVTISRGILYAAQKGATVINMSFGSYARSMAMEDALANAYATTILVAAAGNDSRDIEDEDKTAPNRFYPAALSYVLGVMSPEAKFSNTDKNGPTFSTYDELNNYELKAPGTNVLSTVPNGNYRFYQGTSMAAPIISGAVCLYKAKYSNDSQELMWVKLIQSNFYYLDINMTINITPKSEVRLVSQTMVDSLAGDDNDGRIDAGETIQLWVTVRNTGVQCDSTWLMLRLHEFEDRSNVEFIKPNAFIGSMSSYASRSNQYNPMSIKISSIIAHNRDVVLDLLMWYKGSPDTTTQKVVLNVEKGEQLSGVIDSTLVLTPDKLWLVNNSFKVGSSGHLIIKPGTHIIVYENKYIYVLGDVFAAGTKDSLIYFKGNKIFQFDGEVNRRSTFKYCSFDNVPTPFVETMVGNGRGYADVNNCEFYDCGGFTGIHNFINNSYKFGLISNVVKLGVMGFGDGGIIKYNNINGLGNSFPSSDFDYTWARSGIFDIDNISEFKYNNCVNTYLSNVNTINSSFYYNSILKVDRLLYNASSVPGDIVRMPYQYWGTSDKNKIKMFDFLTREPRWALLDFSDYLTSPSDSCHAITWKVLVNGKDAQDEVVEPVGVGKQRFDVYFNRPMDKNIEPLVSFGVSYPYNQQLINENGFWSEDGKIYSVYKTIKLTTGDGINRIRVAGAKEINGWENEIPVEDTRFNFVISAANSASLEFMATPGLGKVNLEWNNNDLEDGLGYNMYRMEQINDSTLTAPVLINKSLITDTLYTDYSVTPNKKYYYFYKIARTDLSETDSSRVVSAIPFTASKGDANGDLSVNVLDITSIVAYLLNNNPQPFIIEAADLNSDRNINVLDIVGVVNQVLYGGLRSATIAQNQQASLYLENDTLFVNTSAAIGGLQLDLGGVSSINDVQVLTALQGFESGYSQRGIDSLRLIYYSMSGKTIPVGNRIPLLKLKKGSQIVEAIVSDNVGAAIPLSLTAPSIGNTNDQKITVAELGQNYPNPSNGQTILPVQLFENVDEAVIRIFNVFGQEVKVLELDNLNIGKHILQWISGDKKGMFIYKLEIRKDNQQYVCPVKKMIVL